MAHLIVLVVRKRVIIFCLLSVVVLFLLALFSGSASTDSDAPSFLPMRVQPSTGPFNRLVYRYTAEQPFAGDKMWLTTQLSNRTSRCYLLDLQNRRILGELTNAFPVCLNRDQTKVFCLRRRSWQEAFRGRLIVLLDRLSHRRFKLWARQLETTEFWLVDLERRSAKLLGDVRHNQFSGVSCIPSPDFRYCCLGAHPGTTINPGNPMKWNHFICDLEKGTLKQAAADGWPDTWWDEQTVVLRTETNGFFLYHVPTRSVSHLISTAILTAFLAGLHEDDVTPSSTTVFSVGNDGKRRRYLSKRGPTAPDKTSFLARIQDLPGIPQIVSTDFSPQHPNHIDPTETWQLLTRTNDWDYEGAGVLLHELSSGATLTLVPEQDDPESDPGPSTPNFYNDTVIYIRSNCLWQIDLNGSNNARLFPPPEFISDLIP